MLDNRERPLNACRAAFMTRGECDLIQNSFEANIKALRREIRLTVTVSTTLVGIFISILGVLIKTGVV